jgi:hypothetical protein
MCGHTVEVVRNGEDGTLERRDGIPRARVCRPASPSGDAERRPNPQTEVATSSVGERLYGADADGGATSLA